MKKDLVELGRKIIVEIRDSCESHFYEEMDIESVSNECLLKIGEQLYENKELFNYFTNHLYNRDFNWMEDGELYQEIEEMMFDKLISVDGGHKYIAEEDKVVSIVDLNEVTEDVLKYSEHKSIVVQNARTKKYIYVKHYDSDKETYTLKDVNGEYVYFQEEKEEFCIMAYIHSELQETPVEVSAKLNMYFEVIPGLDLSQEELENNFYDCLNTLIESNPAILEKYGFSTATFQLHETELLATEV